MLRTMLMKNARRVRRLLSPEQEYRIRRLMMQATPVSARSPHNLIVHACTWKSASQWVRIVLSDARVYRYSGLKPHFLRQAEVLQSHLADRQKLPKRSILTPAYLTYEQITAAKPHGSERYFFVMRDPRDLVVSRYFSRLSAHPDNERILQLRDELKRMSPTEGLRHTIDDSQAIYEILESWSNQRENPAVCLVRYEDLTGDAGEEAWGKVFAHCGIEMPRATLAALLADYSFEKMSGGRAQGEENASHKYRKGMAGDWVNHFDDATLEHFMTRFGPLMQKLGYR